MSRNSEGKRPTIFQTFSVAISKGHSRVFLAMCTGSKNQANHRVELKRFVFCNEIYAIDVFLISWIVIALPRGAPSVCYFVPERIYVDGHRYLQDKKLFL